jgi:hypothetical protein
VAAPEHARAPRSAPASGAPQSTVVEDTGRIVVRVPSRPDRSEVDAMCRDLVEAARLAGVERRIVETICCDAAAAVHPDVGTIEALARLALTARRLGRPFALAGASPDLLGLLALTGLERLARLGVEIERQSEEGEETLGIEKKGDPGDPTA